MRTRGDVGQILIGALSGPYDGLKPGLVSAKVARPVGKIPSHGCSPKGMEQVDGVSDLDDVHSLVFFCSGSAHKVNLAGLAG